MPQISKTDFCENKLVIDFVTDAFDEEYSQESCPVWINFDLFKTTMILDLSKDLYNTLCDCGVDMITNNLQCHTNWNRNMHIKYSSNSMNDTDLWNKCSDYEIPVPKEILRLVYSDKELVDIMLS